MRCDKHRLWKLCLWVMGIMLMLALGMLLALMLVFGAAQAEGITFRFPDTELPWIPGDETRLPDRQGEVQVHGALVATPCVPEGGWGADGHPHLELSGCGDGLPGRGRVPVAASLRWGKGRPPLALHLYNGITVQLPSLFTTGLAPEVSYE